MAKAFRAGDGRRVQQIFDAALPQPYEAIVTISPDGSQMLVTMADPDDAALPVAQCLFEFEPIKPGKTVVPIVQPDPAEANRIAAHWVEVCAVYPQYKENSRKEAERQKAFALQKSAARAAEDEKRQADAQAYLDKMRQDRLDAEVAAAKLDQAKESAV